MIPIAHQDPARLDEPHDLAAALQNHSPVHFAIATPGPVQAPKNKTARTAARATLLPEDYRTPLSRRQRTSRLLKN